MKQMKKILILLVSALALAGCGKAPETVIESFYGALSKGEITEAKGYVSSQIAAKVGDPKLTSVLTSQAQKISECGGIKNVEVSLKGEGEIRSGTTTVTFDAAACKQKIEKASLVKENGNWKITASK